MNAGTGNKRQRRPHPSACGQNLRIPVGGASPGLGRSWSMPLFLLDRDGVVVVNRSTNIKTAADLELIAGAARAIARLNQAGFKVAICTNQPQVARGVMTKQQLDAVHEALIGMLLAEGATVDLVLSCTALAKCPR